MLLSVFPLTKIQERNVECAVGTIVAVAAEEPDIFQIGITKEPVTKDTIKFKVTSLEASSKKPDYYEQKKELEFQVLLTNIEF